MIIVVLIVAPETKVSGALETLCPNTEDQATINNQQKHT